MLAHGATSKLTGVIRIGSPAAFIVKAPTSDTCLAHQRVPRHRLQRRLVGLVVQRPRQLGEGDLVAEGGEVDERLHVAQRRPADHRPELHRRVRRCRRRRCRCPPSPPACRSSPPPPCPVGLAPGSSTARPRSSPGSRAPARPRRARRRSRSSASRGRSPPRSCAAAPAPSTSSATPAPPPWLAAAAFAARSAGSGFLTSLQPAGAVAARSTARRMRRTHGLSPEAGRGR